MMKDTAEGLLKEMVLKVEAAVACGWDDLVGKELAARIIAYLQRQESAVTAEELHARPAPTDVAGWRKYFHEMESDDEPEEEEDE
jgi:hypothetical protein